MLQESIQQRVADESGVKSKDYQTMLDTNHFLEQQLEEFKLAASQANEARMKAEQIKKTALDQLYNLRQETEIQREDVRSAELDAKKAWKVVTETNAKISAQTKELKEAQDAKIELSAKITALHRNLDEVSASTKLGSVEKSRLETEISTLSRRLKMEQELTRRAEADLAAKTKELGEVKLENNQFSKVRVAAIVEQKERLEAALKDWQTKHAQTAARLDASETQRSRAALEIEDLVIMCLNGTQCRTMNLLDLNR